jgi:hypothetical protein
MKVLPFEQTSRPASTAAPRKDAPKPDVDPARQHAVPPFSDEAPHEEPGYGHGV